MATEGVFPKVDGDILYASEVNRFAKAGEFIAIGSGTPVLSGTAYQDVGSVLIGAGSLTNPAILAINTNVPAFGAGANALQVQISGISTNFTVSINNALSISSVGLHSTGIATFGSPYHGGMIFNSQGDGNDNNTISSVGNLQHLDPNDPIVVNFKVKTSVVSGNVFYNIQSFRSSV